MVKNAFTCGALENSFHISDPNQKKLKTTQVRRPMRKQTEKALANGFYLPKLRREHSILFFFVLFFNSFLFILIKTQFN